MEKSRIFRIAALSVFSKSEFSAFLELGFRGDDFRRGSNGRNRSRNGFEHLRQTGYFKIVVQFCRYAMFGYRLFCSLEVKYLLMKPDLDALGKLLDRKLHGVSDPENASFLEEGQLLFPLEKDTYDRVLKRNAARMAKGEKTCQFAPRGSGVGVLLIGDFTFSFNYDDNILTHDSDHFTIRLMPDTFLSDAEEVLKIVHEQRDLLTRTAPTVVNIGYPPFRRTETSIPAMASCNPPTGTVNIPADRSGGVLVTGFAEDTKEDEFPISSQQVIIHEITHALERNEEVQKKLQPLVEELTSFAKAGFPDPSETARSLTEYCTLIAPGYLPALMNRWKVSPGTEIRKSAKAVASEFWAELCAAAQLSESRPFSNVAAPLPALEGLRDFIGTDYSSLIAGPLTQTTEDSRHRNVVQTLPGPDFSGIHFEYAGDRIAYKLESSGRSGR